MAEDYLKYITGTQEGADPYAVNPFAESAAPGEEGATPFAEELPFRFTQFAINPSTQATSGQSGRSAIARSPYTSGGLASELRDIQARMEGLPTSAPGEMPTAPVMPEMPDMSQFQQNQPYTVDDQGRARTGWGSFSTYGSGAPSSARDMPQMRWGLPIREYQVPARLLEDYPGRNPVDLAIRYGANVPLTNYMSTKNGTNVDYSQYKDSPMTTIEGYDMETLLGADKWNSIVNAKTLGPGEDRFYYNLGILPTSIAPGLENKEHIMSLGMRNFAEPNRTMVDNPAALQAAAEMGYDVSSGRLPNGAAAALKEAGFNEATQILDPNYRFNPEDVKYFLRSNPEKSEERQFFGTWVPRIIQAGAAAVIGGGLGMALGPALGMAAAGGSQAGGLAGALGMSPGLAATGTNLLASTAANLAASKGLEAAGVNMNNPLARMGLGIAGGAMGSLGSGPSAAYPGVENAPILGEGALGGMTNLQDPSSIMNSLQLTAEQTGMSIDDLAINAGYQNADDLVSSVVSRSSYTNPMASKFKGQAFQGLQSGFETYQQVTAPTARGGGIDTTSLYDPAAIEAANTYNTGMSRYNEDLARYEAEMAAYEEAVQQSKLREQLQLEYESKMGEFMKQTNAFKTYNELRSRQQGLSSDIASSIAANPFYDPEENLTGIQSRIF